MEQSRVERLEQCALTAGEPRERRAVEARNPFAREADGVYDDEPTNAQRVARSREHRDATAPRVTEDVPAGDAECFSDCRQVTGVKLDA